MNYLVGAILLSGSLTAEEAKDGWYPVEHSVSLPSEAEKTDPSIWAIFTKNFREEKILVRFPDDPSYGYKSGGIFEAASSKGEEIFQMNVHEKGEIGRRMEEILSLPGASLVNLDRKGEGQMDFLYRLNGKWIQERLIETSHFLYSLQTSSSEPDSGNHLLFADSFRIEKTS